MDIAIFLVIFTSGRDTTSLMPCFSNALHMFRKKIIIIIADNYGDCKVGIWGVGGQEEEGSDEHLAQQKKESYDVLRKRRELANIIDDLDS